ncbi:MAG: sigma-70 family RNA polymerase sigma factor [Tetrasphaera sp.]|nr:sigma-70 family RNA polymerase sigma factor [Tetrasphaera sp.]
MTTIATDPTRTDLAVTDRALGDRAPTGVDPGTRAGAILANNPIATALTAAAPTPTALTPTAPTPTPLTPAAMTPTQLLARCHEGDQRAWDEVVSRYGRLVYSVARRHRLSSAECDDVAQATWVRLVQRTGAIRNPESLADWLATVARNESLRIITRERRAMPLADPLEGQSADIDTASDPAAIALRNEDLRLVAEALGHLPDQQRDLLQLVLQDPPPSYAEIGERLGMPASSVGPTRTRCLRKLRTILEGLMSEEAPSPDRSAGGSPRQAPRASVRAVPTDHPSTQPSAQPIAERTPVMTDAFAIVRDAVAETLDLPADIVTPTATLVDDLGAASLDIVEILFRIERTTDVLLPFEDLVAFVRGDLAPEEFTGPDGRVTLDGRRQLLRALPQWTDATLPNPLHAGDVVGLVAIGNIADRLDARLRARSAAHSATHSATHGCALHAEVAA